jgi:hypothetical protein
MAAALDARRERGGNPIFTKKPEPGKEIFMISMK